MISWVRGGAYNAWNEMVRSVTLVKHCGPCGRAGLAAVPRAGSESGRAEQGASRPLVEDRERRVGRDDSGARMVVADRHGRQGLRDDRSDGGQVETASERDHIQQ